MRKVNDSICDSIVFESTSIRGDGLLGGDYEYNPFIVTWNSFYPYRIERKYQFLACDVSKKEITEPRLKAFKKYACLQTSAFSDKMKSFNSMISFMDDDNDDNHLTTLKSDDGDADSELKVAPHITLPVDTTTYKLKENIVIDQLEDYSDMRGDSSIWFKLMCHTKFSGVDQIDKTDFEFAERQVPDGICTIELYNLFAQYINECYDTKTQNFTNDTCTFKTVFIDPKVTGLYVREQKEAMHKKGMSLTKRDEEKLIAEAYEATYKAMVSFKIKIKGFNMEYYKKSILSEINLKESHLHALSSRSMKNKYQSSSSKGYGNNFNDGGSSKTKGKVQTVPSDADFTPYLFNSKKSIEGMMKHLDHLLTVYCNSFITLEDQVARYKPLNKNVSNLQLPLYISEQGQAPAIAYWTSTDPWTREYPNEEFRKKDLELYGFNDDTEKYFKMMFNSSLRRHGFSKKLFNQTVDTHFSLGNNSTSASPQYLTCLKVVADIGTFAANSAYYTSDYRYLPVYDASSSSYLKNVLYRRGIDSFDSEILNLGSNSDDCEGDDAVLTSIIDAFSYGRYDLLSSYSSSVKVQTSTSTTTKKSNPKPSYQFSVRKDIKYGLWKSKSLQRIQLILYNSVVNSVGSTVTSAYVDTSGKTINIKETDLPIVNDKIDKNSRCDGHCFGFLIPLPTYKKMLMNGNHEKSVIDSFKPTYIGGVDKSTGQLIITEHDKFMTRDEKTQPLALEGTGSTEPTVLPINEVYKDNIERRKMTTHKLFLKSVKAILMEIGGGIEVKESKERDEMMNMFNCEGMPFYIEEQPEDRRASSFYREVVHTITPRAYLKHSVTLSQSAFCKKRADGSGEYKYGVNMGELMRASNSPNANGIALISPYSESKDEWFKSTIPMLESIQNQMPFMAFGRYTKEQYDNEIYSYYINPSTLHIHDYKFPSSMNEINAIERSLSEPTNWSNQKGYDKRNIKKNSNIARFHTVCENDDEMVVPLYSRTWKLNKSKEQMIKFQKFIESLPGLKHYGFFVEKHLPNCDALVEILCIVDVNKVLNK